LSAPIPYFVEVEEGSWPFFQWKGPDLFTCKKSCSALYQNRFSDQGIGRGVS
jgi:hypothetical protein